MKSKPTPPTSSLSAKLENKQEKTQNGDTAKTKRDTMKEDISLLMKSITTSVSSLAEIIKVFENATPEVCVNIILYHISEITNYL